MLRALKGALRRLARKVVRPEHLTNLSLTFPARPVFLVQFHELDRRFDCLFLRLQLKLRVAPDDFLSFGERPVDHGHLASGKPDAGTLRGRQEPAIAQHGAGFSVCLTIIMNRMVISPLSVLVGEPSSDGFDRPDLGSIYASNNSPKNR